MMKDRPQASAWIAVGAAVAAYLNSFRGAFQFDDFNVIVNNPAVHSLAAWAYDAPRGIRPLLKLTYALNWTSGWGPFGFHLFNVAVHAANTLLIFLLSRRFFKRRGNGEGRFAGTAPLLAALLFALHPVQTESVTYICGRSMSLMALFFLGSLLAYDHGAESCRKVLLHVVSPLLFLFSVLTKETAVVLPFALLLWEAGGIERISWTSVLRRQAVHWVLLACACAALLVHPVSRELIFYGYGARSASANLLCQVNGVSYLLSRLVFFARLNIDPDLPVRIAWSPALAVQAFFLAGLVLLGVFALRKRHWLGFGILWLFLQLAPTNSLVPRLDVANERHLYLAAWGIFLVIGAAAERLLGSLRSDGRRAWAAILAGTVVLGCFTIARNDVFRSEISLWEETVKASPDKPRAYNNLGYAYQLDGQTGRAIRAYGDALRRDPANGRAQGNLAAAIEAAANPFPPLGRIPAGDAPGAEDFRQEIRSSPSVPESPQHILQDFI